MFLLVSILTETQPSCHKPRLDKMVSAGGPQWRGTHDQWLVKRLSPVRVAIGDFDAVSSLTFLGSVVQHSLVFEVPPTPAFLGVGTRYVVLRTGDESRERGKHRRQARTQASDEKPRDREKG